MSSGRTSPAERAARVDDRAARPVHQAAAVWRKPPAGAGISLGEPAAIFHRTPGVPWPRRERVKAMNLEGNKLVGPWSDEGRACERGRRSSNRQTL